MINIAAMLGSMRACAIPDGSSQCRSLSMRPTDGHDAQSAGSAGPGLDACNYTVSCPSRRLSTEHHLHLRSAPMSMSVADATGLRGIPNAATEASGAGRDFPLDERGNTQAAPRKMGCEGCRFPICLVANESFRLGQVDMVFLLDPPVTCCQAQGYERTRPPARRCPQLP